MKSKPLSTIYGDVMDKVTRVKWSKMNLYPSTNTRTKIVKYTVSSCAIIFLLNMLVFYGKSFPTWSVWWRDGFLSIFALAFLLFLAPAGGSNPAGLIF